MPVVAAPHQLPLTSWTSNMTLYVSVVLATMLVGQDSHVHLTALALETGTGDEDTEIFITAELVQTYMLLLWSQSHFTVQTPGTLGVKLTLDTPELSAGVDVVRTVVSPFGAVKV